MGGRRVELKRFVDAAGFDGAASKKRIHEQRAGRDADCGERAIRVQNLLFIFFGALFAVAFVLFAERAGSYRKEKRVYALGLIAAAVIYVGFGLFSGSLGWQLTELAGLLVYSLFAFAGVRRSGWFLCGGWALHMVWDVLMHGASTDFVPHWYRMACFGFDVLVAARISMREWRLK